MAQQKITVSRAQCAIQVGMDGQAMLQSRGRGPTGWRQGYNQWTWLRQGETRPLQSGDAISLDVNDPEGAVFTCTIDGQGGQGGYGQQGGYGGQQGGYGGQQGGYGGQQGGYGGQQGGYGGQQGGYGGQQGGYGGQQGGYGGQQGGYGRY